MFNNTKEKLLDKSNQKTCSRFKPWIRIVSFIIVFCLFSNDIAMAIGYNPSVLFGSRSAERGENGFLINFAIDNIKISLDSLSYKDLHRVEISKGVVVEAKPFEEKFGINLSPEKTYFKDHPFLAKVSHYFRIASRKFLEISIKGVKKISTWGKSEEDLNKNSPPAAKMLTDFLEQGLNFVESEMPYEKLSKNPDQPEPLYLTSVEIKRLDEWLKSPKTNIDANCGVYSLYNLLKDQGIETTPEEVAVRLVLVDFLSGNLREFKGRFEASLYALNLIARSFGVDSSLINVPAAKVENSLSDIIPFIAYVQPEHFILITSYDGKNVYFKEGLNDSWFSKETFHEKFSGNCLITNINKKDYSLILDKDALAIKGAGGFGDLQMPKMPKMSK
ncbi:MAG: hypothetical protein KAI91_06570, partial [Candidatus Omnitrophica bacterium]|nr:hypothetical protein [Candidatus Omnitrophota bacterium]